MLLFVVLGTVSQDVEFVAVVRGVDLIMMQRQRQSFPAHPRTVIELMIPAWMLVGCKDGGFLGAGAAAELNPVR